MSFRKELDENNPAHEVFARQLLSRLIELLEERAGSSAEFINRFTIQNYAAQFKVFNPLPHNTAC